MKVKLSLGTSDGKEKLWSRERERLFLGEAVASNNGKALPSSLPSHSGDTYRLIYFYRIASATFRGDCFPPFTPSYLFSHFCSSTQRLPPGRLLLLVVPRRRKGMEDIEMDLRLLLTKRIYRWITWKKNSISMLSRYLLFY